MDNMGNASAQPAPEIIFSVELRFDSKDLARAEAWALRYGYKYETREQLMYDALCAGIVRSDFKEGL